MSNHVPCPKHPRARTLPTTVNTDWGTRRHRCEHGHTFYLRDGVWQVACKSGGVPPDDVPCGACGEQTFARQPASLDGATTCIRQCWNGHNAHYVPGTNEFICETIQTVAYDGPCVVCNRPRWSTRSWKGRKCSACCKAMTRMKRRMRGLSAS